MSDQATTPEPPVEEAPVRLPSTPEARADKARANEEKSATQAVDPAEPVDREIRGHNVQGELVVEVFAQGPLSFFGKAKLIELLGDAVDKALDQGGVSIQQLLEMQREFAEEGGIKLDAEEVSDKQAKQAEEFIKLITQLVRFVPDLLPRLLIVILGVPRGSRERILDAMTDPVTGISDDEMEDIVGLFFEQNSEAVRDFFGGRGRRLAERISKAMTAGDSPEGSPG